MTQEPSQEGSSPRRPDGAVFNAGTSETAGGGGLGAPPHSYGASSADPYGASPAEPYGVSQPPPAATPYSPAPPLGTGTPPYMPPAGYAQTLTPTPTSTMVLVIISAVGILFCWIAALPPLIIGIVALNKNKTDQAGAIQLTNIGWVLFAVLNAVSLIAFLAYFAFFFPFWIWV